MSKKKAIIESFKRRIDPKNGVKDTLLRTNECHYGRGDDFCQYHESMYELDPEKVLEFIKINLKVY